MKSARDQVKILFSRETRSRREERCNQSYYKEFVRSIYRWLSLGVLAALRETDPALIFAFASITSP